jgi:phenylpyruvate tautomerase PptA (4-oxalocrotonate tautomerase family)
MEMPFLEIRMLEMDRTKIELLAKRMNQDFIDATGFEDEILRIQFVPYDRNTLAIRGEFGSEPEFVHMILFSPRLRFDVKRGLVSALTQAFREVSGKADSNVMIHLHEFPYDNIGVDGQLLTDMDDELASRPYYYVLPH